MLPRVVDVAVVWVVGAVVDCLAATALSSPGCAAGGVTVFTVSSMSARSGVVVVVTVSGTARTLLLPLACSGRVAVGAKSAGGAGARLRDTVGSWEATVESEELTGVTFPLPVPTA